MAKIPQRPGRSGSYVQTHIAGSSSIRSRVETPEGIGKVERINRNLPKRQRRRSSRGRRQSRRGLVLRRWLVLGLSVTGLTIIGGLLYALLVAPAPVPRAQLTGNKIYGKAFPSLPVEEGLGMVESMFEASQPEELEGLLRPGTIGPDEALARLATLLPEKKEDLRPKWLGRIDSKVRAFDLVLVSRPLQEPLSVPLTPDQDGEWKIDFDAMVGHCSPNFDAWVEGDVDRGTVRCIAKFDTYYNAAFRDEREWVCISFSHPDHPTRLYAYCERDGLSHQAMEKIVERNIRMAKDVGTEADETRPFRTMLELTHSDRFMPNQFEIVEVLSDDWIASQPTYEEVLERQADSASMVIPEFELPQSP
jgi:hypothetical protein